MINSESQTGLGIESTVKPPPGQREEVLARLRPTFPMPDPYEPALTEGTGSGLHPRKLTPAQREWFAVNYRKGDVSYSMLKRIAAEHGITISITTIGNIVNGKWGGRGIHDENSVAETPRTPSNIRGRIEHDAERYKLEVLKIFLGDVARNMGNPKMVSITPDGVVITPEKPLLPHFMHQVATNTTPIDPEGRINIIRPKLGGVIMYGSGGKDLPQGTPIEVNPPFASPEDIGVNLPPQLPPPVEFSGREIAEVLRQEVGLRPVERVPIPLAGRAVNFLIDLEAFHIVAGLSGGELILEIEQRRKRGGSRLDLDELAALVSPFTTPWKSSRAYMRALNQDRSPAVSLAGQVRRDLRTGPQERALQRLERGSRGLPRKDNTPYVPENAAIFYIADWRMNDKSRAALDLYTSWIRLWIKEAYPNGKLAEHFILYAKEGLLAKTKDEFIKSKMLGYAPAESSVGLGLAWELIRENYNPRDWGIYPILLSSGYNPLYDQKPSFSLLLRMLGVAQQVSSIRVIGKDMDIGDEYHTRLAGLTKLLQGRGLPLVTSEFDVTDGSIKKSLIELFGKES